MISKLMPFRGRVKSLLLLTLRRQLIGTKLQNIAVSIFCPIRPVWGYIQFAVDGGEAVARLLANHGTSPGSPVCLPSNLYIRLHQVYVTLSRVTSLECVSNKNVDFGSAKPAQEFSIPKYNRSSIF